MTVTEEPIEGFKETEIGLLPKDWEIHNIADIADVSSGGSAPQGEDYFLGTNPFIRVQHIELESDVIFRWDLITDEAVKTYKLKLFPKGTIVFPKSGASIYLEKRAMLPMDSYIVSHLCAINSKNSKLWQKYFFFSLKNIKFSKDKADGYPTLNLSEIKIFKIPLPPLPEQQKIASVLSSIQEAKEKTKNVIFALKELKKSMMKHLFTYGPVPIEEAEKVPLKETEIGLIPEHWEVVKIDDVITLSQYGLSVRGNLAGKYPILRMNSMQGGRLDLTDLQYVDVDEVTFEKFKLNKGDILFNRTNSYELVGKVAMFDDDTPLVFASYIVRLITDSSKVVSQYLNYYLNWLTTQDRLKMLASRGVSQSNINATKLKAFFIPLPPLSEQRQIAEILSAIDAKIVAEENKKNALESLFKTLLSLLMTGKIRVKDLEI